MKNYPLTLIVALVIALFLTACGTEPQQCPVNNERVKLQAIPISLAKQYRASYEQGLAQLEAQLKDPAFLRDSFNIPQAEMFNRDAIGALLNVQGADGVRIYLGRDNAGQIRMVLLPVDKEGKDIISNLTAKDVAKFRGVPSAHAQEGEDGEAIENGQRCPTYCDGTW